MKKALISLMLAVTLAAPSVADRIRHPGLLAQLGTHCTTTCTRAPFPPYTQTCQTHCY